VFIKHAHQTANYTTDHFLLKKVHELGSGLVGCDEELSVCEEASVDNFSHEAPTPIILNQSLKQLRVINILFSHLVPDRLRFFDDAWLVLADVVRSEAVEDYH